MTEKKRANRKWIKEYQKKNQYRCYQVWRCDDTRSYTWFFNLSLFYYRHILSTIQPKNKNKKKSKKKITQHKRRETSCKIVQFNMYIVIKKIIGNDGPSEWPTTWNFNNFQSTTTKKQNVKKGNSKLNLFFLVFRSFSSHLKKKNPLVYKNILQLVPQLQLISLFILSNDSSSSILFVSRFTRCLLSTFYFYFVFFSLHFLCDTQTCR